MPNSASLLKAIDPTFFCVQVPIWSSGSDFYVIAAFWLQRTIYISVGFNGENIVSVSLICHLEERR